MPFILFDFAYIRLIPDRQKILDFLAFLLLTLIVKARIRVNS